MKRKTNKKYILKRFKQIKSCNELFGGLCIVLAEDPTELPPVKASSLWTVPELSTKNDDRNGYNIYKSFDEVVL